MPILSIHPSIHPNAIRKQVFHFCHCHLLSRLLSLTDPFALLETNVNLSLRKLMGDNLIYSLSIDPVISCFLCPCWRQNHSLKFYKLLSRYNMQGTHNDDLSLLAQCEPMSAIFILFYFIYVNLIS